MKSGISSVTRCPAPLWWAAVYPPSLSLLCEAGEGSLCDGFHLISTWYLVSLLDLEACLELQPNWLGSCRHAWHLTFPVIWQLDAVSFSSSHWQGSCSKLNGPPQTLRLPPIWLVYCLCLVIPGIFPVLQMGLSLTLGMLGPNTILEYGVHCLLFPGNRQIYSQTMLNAFLIPPWFCSFSVLYSHSHSYHTHL